MASASTMATVLRELREARSLSLSEAARRADLSRGTLRNWENGVHVPTCSALERLLDALRAEPRERASLLAAASPRQAQDALADGPLGAPVSRGAILRALRVRRALTQGALAQSMGVTQSAVAKWEAGDTVPGEETHARLMVALGAAPEEAKLVRSAGETAELLSIEETNAWVGRLFAVAGTGASIEPFLLAHEAEMWRRAANDSRWEPSLFFTMALRAGWLGSTGDRSAESYTLAQRALGLAVERGAWEAAVGPFFVLLLHGLSRACEDPHAVSDEIVRDLRRSESLMKRTKSPEMRASLLVNPHNLIAAELRAPGDLYENVRRVEDAIANWNAPSLPFFLDRYGLASHLSIAYGMLGRFDEAMALDETTDWSALPDAGVWTRAVNLSNRMWSYVQHGIEPSMDDLRRFEASATIYASTPSLRNTVRDWHRANDARKRRSYV